MFNNLKAEMARNKIFCKDIASFLRVSPKTFSNKLNGYTEFNCKEMYLIKKTFFPRCTIDYLFDDVQIPKGA